MEWIFWAIFTVFILIGFIGIIMPLLPSLIMFPLAVGLIYFGLPGYFSLYTLMFCIAVFLGSYLVDFIGTLIGAKWGGASKWGLIGATLGGFIGMFWGLVGLLFGPLVGAFAAELFFSSRTPEQAVRAGLGAGMGLLAASLIKIGLAVVMFIVVLVDLFWLV